VLVRFELEFQLLLVFLGCNCFTFLTTILSTKATVVPNTEQDFMEMQESERYGAWHPRYRVPKPVFGFSKPFAHRHAPSLK